uniref:Uncharacterized protein n=1 Tax=Meloidogyne enterolobii TaxID=390850 RepID=A0A6V7TQ51_MELEN|nr:unnamed protein product [Meloidogyne enterolobii]
MRSLLELKMNGFSTNQNIVGIILYTAVEKSLAPSFLKKIF